MDFAVTVVMFCVNALRKHFQSIKLNISLNARLMNPVVPIQVQCKWVELC